jgi:hypothetical protein
MTGEMFLLTTGNGKNYIPTIGIAFPLMFWANFHFAAYAFKIVITFYPICSGTVEVLSYPSLQPLETVMAHTAGCYCIAIDPKGR